MPFSILLLLGFSVSRVFLAESAVLVTLESFRRGLAVLKSVVVALFALGASQNNLDSVTFLRCHNYHSPVILCQNQSRKSIFLHTKNYTPERSAILYYHTALAKSTVFRFFTEQIDTFYAKFYFFKGQGVNIGYYNIL